MLVTYGGAPVTYGGSNVTYGPDDPPAPTPTINGVPTVAPSPATLGQLLTATDAPVSNGTTTAREWLRGSAIVATGATYTPTIAGTYRYRQSAGSASATSAPVEVSPVVVPEPGDPITITPSYRTIIIADTGSRIVSV